MTVSILAEKANEDNNYDVEPREFCLKCFRVQQSRVDVEGHRPGTEEHQTHTTWATNPTHWNVRHTHHKPLFLSFKYLGTVDFAQNISRLLPGQVGYLSVSHPPSRIICLFRKIKHSLSLGGSQGQEPDPGAGAGTRGTFSLFLNPMTTTLPPMSSGLEEARQTRPCFLRYHPKARH
jgi:hypothetical protein